MISRIAILGTGLLGTSVGLALRAAGFKGAIAGWNRSPEHGQLALKMGAIDSVAADPLEAARASQVTVLAVPIYATLDFMEKLAPVLGSEHMVTDVGSTKRIISEAAARLYNTPERAAFLPGHPMAGKERGGAALGDANLFRGAVWLFTDDPAAQRSPHSAELVKGWREWVAAMGSKDPRSRPRPPRRAGRVGQPSAAVHGHGAQRAARRRSRRRARAQRCGRPRPARDDAPRREPLLHVARHRPHQHRSR